MSLVVFFNKKSYSFPEDIVEYLQLLDLTEKIQDELFSTFLSLTSSSDIKVISAEDMISSFKEQASIFIKMLCSKGIFSKTIDEYAINNDGYKEFKRICENAVAAFSNFLSDEIGNFISGMEQAEINAHSQITGSGVSIFSNSALMLAAATAAEYSILKKQANKADEQYRRELEIISNRGTTERERKENIYLIEHYYPDAKQAFRLFTSILLEKYISDLLNAGLFDKSVNSYINLERSKSLLESLKIVSNKDAIFEQAFLACPFNPLIYIEMSNLGLIDDDTFKTSKIFKADSAIKDNLSQRLNDVLSNKTMSLREKISTIDQFLPSICVITHKAQSEYYKLIGKSFYEKIVSDYLIIKSIIVDKEKGKELLLSFEEDFFDNDNDYIIKAIRLYTRKRINSIVSDCEFITLMNECGYLELLKEISPDNKEHLALSKKDLDDYYICALSDLLISLLPDSVEEYKNRKKKENEDRMLNERLHRNCKIVVSSLFVVLLVVPLILNIVLGIIWVNKAENYVELLISKKFETLSQNSQEELTKIGGVPSYRVKKITLYKDSWIGGSCYIVPLVEYKTYSSGDDLSIRYFYNDFLAEYSNVEINVPFYISFNSGYTQIWGDAIVITPDGSKFIIDNIFSDMKSDNTYAINPLFSKQFIFFYLVYIAILVFFYLRIEKMDFNIDLLIKNKTVKNNIANILQKDYDILNKIKSLYHNKKLAFLSICSFVLLCSLFVSLVSNLNNSANSEVNYDNFKLITDDGHFTTANKIYSKLSNNLSFYTKFKFFHQEPESGGLGLYKEEAIYYSYIISCLNKDANNLELDSQLSPYVVNFCIIIHDNVCPTKDFAYFIDSFSKTHNIKEIEKMINNQIIIPKKEISENKIAVVYENSIYFVFSQGENDNKIYVIMLMENGINIIEKNPNMALSYIFINDHDSNDSIYNLSNEDAKYLLKYYLSHLTLGIEKYDELVKMAKFSDNR